MTTTIRSSKKSKLPYFFGAVAIVVIIGVIYAVYHSNHKNKPIPTLNQYTKGQTSQTGSTTNSSNQPSNQSSSSKTGGGNTSLVAPSGNFVSNHHPNLSGSPAPNSMTSVCNSSPGASCKISFTNGNTIKSLPIQTTDAGGVTYWYWKLQDIGLTAGTWKVTATSSNSTNSLSSTDPANLVVSQ